TEEPNSFVLPDYGDGVGLLLVGLRRSFTAGLPPIHASWSRSKGWGTLNAGRRFDTASDTSRISGAQWLRAKAAFYEALSRPVDEREAFIGEVCQGDAALASVIRSLLASDRSAGDFLEAPAVARVGVPSPTRTALSPGEQVGAYEIVGLLGAGGMGEGDRARDHRLARGVGIKVLPADVMHDGVDRQRRRPGGSTGGGSARSPEYLSDL